MKRQTARRRHRGREELNSDDGLFDQPGLQGYVGKALMGLVTKKNREYLRAKERQRLLSQQQPRRGLGMSHASGWNDKSGRVGRMGEGPQTPGHWQQDIQSRKAGMMQTQASLTGHPKTQQSSLVRNSAAQAQRLLSPPADKLSLPNINFPRTQKG